MNNNSEQQSLAMHGMIILLLGLLAGIGFSVAAATAEVTAPAYGNWRFAHMEGLLNGLLVLVVAALWGCFSGAGKSVVIAKWLLVLGCYANIIGPIITALFIGHRVVEPHTALENIVVYGFYIPGTLPLISIIIFAQHLALFKKQ